MEREREQGSDRLDTEERKELNDSDFGLPEERKYPMQIATNTHSDPLIHRYTVCVGWHIRLWQVICVPVKSALSNICEPARHKVSN